MNTSKQIANTTLGDWGRTLRDEPLHYIYRHKIWVKKDDVPADQVHAWLKNRYAETRRGNRYRIVTYRHKGGEQYVDYVLMETCKDVDLVYMKLQWGWSDQKVFRGEREPRRRLNPEQRKALDRVIRQTRMEFYEAMDRARDLT